mmetsp:Transcript_27550/g.37882  ORF Transcript_27550/g.37882 Transcript_27550/m.37882 type:complete len:1909 (-) Transcript_27550:548-6274(-)
MLPKASLTVLIAVIRLILQELQVNCSNFRVVGTKRIMWKSLPFKQHRFRLECDFSIGDMSFSNFNEQLSLFAEKGDPDGADKLLRAMRESHSDLDDFFLNQETYTQLIRAYINYNKTHITDETFSDDKAHNNMNRKENIYSNDTIISEINLIFSQMLLAGYSPNISLCSEILLTFSLRGADMQVIDAFFDRVMLYVTPDIELYNSYLKSCSIQMCRSLKERHYHEYLQKMSEIFKRMMYVGISPNIFSYSYLFDVLFKGSFTSNNKIQLQQRYNSDGVLNLAWKSFQQLVRIYYSKGDIESESRYLLRHLCVQMLQICFYSSDITSLMIKAVSTAVLNLLDAVEIELDQQCYDAMMNLYSHSALEGGFELMNALYSKVNHASSLTTRNTIHHMLDAANKAQQMAISLNILRSMHLQRIPVTLRQYQDIIGLLGDRDLLDIVYIEVIPYLSNSSGIVDIDKHNRGLLMSNEFWNSIISASGNIPPTQISVEGHDGNAMSIDSMSAAFRKMVSIGVTPDSRIYSKMIELCTLRHNLAAAADYFNRAKLEAMQHSPKFISSKSLYGLVQEYVLRIQRMRNSMMDHEELKVMEAKIMEVFRYMCDSYKGIMTSSISQQEDISLEFILSTHDLLLKEKICCESITLFELTLQMISIKPKPRPYRPLLKRKGISEVDDFTSKYSSLDDDEFALSHSDKAIEIFQNLRTFSLAANLECYLYLMRSLELDVERRPQSVPDRALEIVRYMIANGEIPTEETFETLLRIWVNSKRSDSPKIAESIFKTIVAYSNRRINRNDEKFAGPVDSPKVDREIFVLLLECWAKSPLPTAVTKAEEVIGTMQQIEMELCSKSYSLIVYAYMKAFNFLRVAERSNRSNITSSDGAEVTSSNLQSYIIRAEDYYNQSIEHGFDDNESMIRSMISLWCWEGSEKSLQKIDHLLTSLSLRGIRIHPSLYRMIVNAWHACKVTSGKTARQRADDFLYQLRDSFGCSGGQLYMSYNLLFTTFDGKSLDEMKDLFMRLTTSSMLEKPQLDFVTTNLMLECIRDSGLFSPSQVALQCDELLDLSFERLGNKTVNDHTFQTMLQIWQKVSEDTNAGELALTRNAVLFRACFLLDKLNTENLIICSRSRRRSFELLVEYSSKHRPSLAVEIMNTMPLYGMPATASLYSRVIAGGAAVNNADLCESTIFKMMSAGFKPAPYTCRIVLNALATASSLVPAERIENAVNRMMQMGVQLDTYMLSSLLQALSRTYTSTTSSIDASAADRAEVWFQRAFKSGVTPTLEQFNQLISVLSKTNRDDSAERAERVLRSMKDRGVHPDIVSYNSVISAWGKRRSSLDVNADINLAMGILQSAIQDGLQPDVVTYTSVLSVMSRSRDASIPQKASALFDSMIAAGIEPDRMAWTILMGIWCKSSDPNKEMTVQAIFKRMLHSGCAPNIITYTAMLSMWADSRNTKASRYVIEVFHSMQQTGVKFDTKAYSSLLQALGRAQMLSNDRKRLSNEETGRDETLEDIPQRANEVFENMLAAGLKPDTTAYTILINIWSNSAVADKEERVQEIFHRMLRDESCKPNAVTYTALLKMWSNSHQSIALRRIVEIFNSMCNDLVYLDGVAFNALSRALTKVYGVSQAADKAEQLLALMVNYGMVPDVLAWDTVMNLDKASGANRVRLIRLYSLMQTVGVTPSKQIFDSLLSNIVKHNSLPAKTNRKSKRDNGDSNASLTLGKASSHHNANDTVLTVESIIQRMNAARVPPTTKTFNYLFLAIARSVDAVQDRAWLLQKCRDTYDTMTKTHGLLPDKMTVGLMVKVHLRIDHRDLPEFDSCSAEYMDLVFNLLLSHTKKSIIYQSSSEIVISESEAKETVARDDQNTNSRLDDELVEIANGLILLWRRSNEKDIARKRIRKLQRLVNLDSNHPS